MDRQDVLSRAEKFVRQGQLHLAIIEYKRLVDEYPDDWSAANALGDLYLRAQQTDKAVEQYLQIANRLAQEGFLAKAAAFYKKALKIKPSDDHALLRLGELAVMQSRFAEARQYFTQAATCRSEAGNFAGAAEMLMRIASLNPEDLQARLSAVRAVGEAGQTAVAAGELLSIADELEARGRTAEFLAVLEEAGRLVPEDDAVRMRIARGLAQHGQAERAYQYARTAEDYRDLASVFTAAGDDDAVLECLKAVARLNAADASTAARLVETYVRRGDLAAAQPYLTAAAETNDTGRLLLVCDVLCRSGRLDEARIAFTRLLARAPHTTREVVDTGVRLVSEHPAAALVCIESAASSCVLRGDYGAAIDAYERLLERDPANVTALMSLVELCADGSLDDQLVDARRRLVDAQLRNGRALEARAVAEDLASRTRDQADIARLRRVLEATGEPDPDHFVAETLGPPGPPVEPVPVGQPEKAADNLVAHQPPPPDPEEEVVIDFIADVPPELIAAAAPAASELVHAGAPTADPFRPGPLAIDLRSILGEALDADPPRGFEQEAHVTDEGSGRPPAGGTAGNDEKDVFSAFHEEVSREAEAALAEQHYKVGLAYRDMGMISQAIAELELAVRSPKLRFEAASLLARLSLQHGATAEAIEWFERAAEAPAPSAEAARGLLYELGDTLETSGEAARALAVFMELQAEAGDYRDVGRRIQRLSRVQTGG